MRTTAIAAALLATLVAATPAFAQTTTEPTSPDETTSSPEPLPVWLKLSAYSGHPGEKVSVAAACGDEASPLTTRALRVTQPLEANPEGHQPWALFAETVIRDVPEGSYPVSFHCGGDPVTVYFTVLHRDSSPAPSSGQSKKAPGPGQTRVVPQGAPQTGDGSLAP
ncbi:hypothetical protein GCM10017786_65750 [Amycolatopsis deserti]|uniref:Secreted protein n=1 Tax=Amycolatopsis deserti TaxID=185696 RepID=A0ABQ3JDW0_9PSEU|nr:hypothetical protein [Amycolatopsis deserti]GHF22573.1 hypothetical protein GCM10017786_65750 [Amycolatopsis deserti]